MLPGTTWVSIPKWHLILFNVLVGCPSVTGRHTDGETTVWEHLLQRQNHCLQCLLKIFFFYLSSILCSWSLANHLPPFHLLFYQALKLISWLITVHLLLVLCFSKRNIDILHRLTLAGSLLIVLRLAGVETQTGRDTQQTNVATWPKWQQNKPKNSIIRCS